MIYSLISANFQKIIFNDDLSNEVCLGSSLKKGEIVQFLTSEIFFGI